MTATAPTDAAPAGRSDGPDAASGKGGAIAIFGAKIYFLVTSMALGLGLIALLPAAEYGQYFVVNDTVSLIGAVLVGGLLQSVSRQVAQDPDRVFDIRRTALRTLGTLGAALSLGLVVVAWPLATLVFEDPDLTRLLIVAAPIPVAYSMYAVHIGVLNGRRRFGRQAAFDIGFATSKTALMLGAAFAGFGAFGALGGFALTSVLVLLVATPLSRAGRPTGERYPARRLLSFSVVTILYVLAVNLVLRIDPWIVKAALPKEAVGVYGVALQVARIPYQLSVALALVVFPFLARMDQAALDRVGAAYVERALRYGLLLAGGGAALLAGNAPEALRLLGRPEAAPLVPLVGPAMLAYTMTFLCCTVLVSLGRAGAALGVATMTALAVTVLTSLWVVEPIAALIPAAAAELPPGLVGASHAVLAANLLGALVGTIVVVRVAAVPVTWRPIGALALIGALTWAGTLWTSPGLMVVPECVGLALAAGAVSILTGVTPLAELRELAGPRTKPAARSGRVGPRVTPLGPTCRPAAAPRR